MKVFVITLALAGLASAATLDAQILGSRPVPTSSGSVNVDASWRVAGRDRNGNMQIINSRTEVVNNGNNNGRNDCAYNQSSNTVGDIIFGRSNNNVDCTDNGTRVDGGWYQVGRGRDNNSIYERRVRDRNGNLVIQRARRNSNGGFTILSTRRANDNDKQWRKAQKEREKEMRKSEHDYKHDNKGNGRGNDR